MRITAAFLATLFLTYSCTDSNDENEEEKYKVAFDTWMELNINKNGVTKAMKQDNGMYIEWLERGPAGAPAPITGDWLMINYRGMNLSNYDADSETGDIFMTRYREDARRFVVNERATDTAYTHFVPHYIQNSRYNGMMPGQQAALKMMKKGDRVRLYLPYELAYGGSSLTRNNGYGGQFSQGSGPVIVEMELVDIIDDPQDREEKIVRDYAVGKWGMTENDTIKHNLYLQVTDHIAGSDTVRTDSTISIYFTGRFAEDDFVFETNIDTIATPIRRIPFYSDSRYTSYASNFILFRASYNTVDEAFTEAVESGLITYGCRFRMVFTSEYGNGNTEGISYSEPYTEVQMYTPLVYEVYVEPYKEDEEEE